MQVPLGDTYEFTFTSRQFSTGAPFTLAGTPSLAVYEEGNLTQITAGITLTADYDSVTGLNNVSIVCTGGNGYEAGKYYSVVIAAGTVDSVSVVGETVGRFRIMAAEDAAGVPHVKVAAMAAAVLDAAAIATDAITAAKIAADAITSAKIATGAIDADALASDTITAAKIASDAIDAAALATDAINEIADGFLNRDMSTGTDSGSTTVRTPRQALRFLRNYWDVSGGTLTVRKEDDSTTSWTAAVSVDASADPVVGSNPAGGFIMWGFSALYHF